MSEPSTNDSERKKPLERSLTLRPRASSLSNDRLGSQTKKNDRSKSQERLDPSQTNPPMPDKTLKPEKNPKPEKPSNPNPSPDQKEMQNPNHTEPMAKANPIKVTDQDATVAYETSDVTMAGLSLEGEEDMETSEDKNEANERKIPVIVVTKPAEKKLTDDEDEADDKEENVDDNEKMKKSPDQPTENNNDEKKQNLMAPAANPSMLKKTNKKDKEILQLKRELMDSQAAQETAKKAIESLKGEKSKITEILKKKTNRCDQLTEECDKLRAELNRKAKELDELQQRKKREIEDILHSKLKQCFYLIFFLVVNLTTSIFFL